MIGLDSRETAGLLIKELIVKSKWEGEKAKLVLAPSVREKIEVTVREMFENLARSYFIEGKR